MAFEVEIEKITSFRNRGKHPSSGKLAASIHPDGTIYSVNDCFVDVLGYAPRYIAGKKLSTVLSLPEGFRLPPEHTHELILLEGIYRMYSVGGDIHYMDVVLIRTIPDDTNAPLILIAYDASAWFEYHVVQNHQLMSRERESEAINLSLQEHIELLDETVITVRLNLEGKIRYASSSFSRITGFSHNELLRMNVENVVHPRFRRYILTGAWRNLREGKSWEGEVRIRKNDNHFFWIAARVTPRFDADGQMTGYMCVCHPNDRKKELEKLTYTDNLTGIYNRKKFDDSLLKEINRIPRRTSTFSVIMFDVDFFKNINDNHGHHAGDEVLIAIVEFVRTMIGGNDIFARWGGEEFIILLPRSNHEDACNLAERLRNNIARQSFSGVGNVTASFGVTEYIPGEDDEELIRRVDQALYVAKNGGRNRIICE